VVIDVHAHIIVPEILRQVAPEETWRPAVDWHNGQQVIDFGGKPIRSAIREFVHIDRILEEQDKAGVDLVVLAPWVSLLGYDSAPQDGLRICRIQNEALARLAQTYPQRVAALGSVPLQDPELAASELADLMREPGVRGVEIAASIGNDYLGHERFRPFWAAAEESGAVVFIHPTTRGFNLPVLNDYYLWNSVGNPMETAVTAAHMVMAGVMESHPRLKVILAHAGGAVLALRGRLRHSHSFQPQARAVLRENPDESLNRFYYDTLTHDPQLLQSLIDYVGAERVLVGSDYPFDMGDDHPADIVRRLKLDNEAYILHDNAVKLLGLEL
jgi:aminocarboxymuconate-semialdehyde decarboxylase